MKGRQGRAYLDGRRGGLAFSSGSTQRALLASLVAFALLVSPLLASPAFAELTADPGGPYSGVVDHKLRFDGTGSTGGDDDIDEYLWDFGDGETKSGDTPDHTYRTPGTFEVTLQVIDKGGNTATASTTATILPNQPPIPDPGGPYEAEVGNNVQFDGSGSIDVDGKIEHYRWDFGDGRTGKGATPEHSYPTEGLYTVTLTVTDDDDATAELSTTATITDPNPPIPSVSITAPPTNAILAGTVPVAATTTDDSRVESVQFLVDGASLGTDTDPPWSIRWDTTESSNGDHTLAAIATDLLNRTSQDSVTVTVSNDPTPSLTITKPTNGAVLKGGVTIEAAASDDTTRVDFYVDERLIGIDSTGDDGWSASWDTTENGNGDHEISAVASSQSGQTATDTVIVTVENRPPTTTTTTTSTTTTTTTLPPTTTTTTTLPPTTTTTTSAPTTTTSSPTTTTDPTTTTLAVLGQRIESSANPAVGVSATLFAVVPLASTPGGEITLTLQVDADVSGSSELLFLLDELPLGEPVSVTTGRESTFTRLVPADLSIGLHRIAVATTDDPPRILASRSLGVTVGRPAAAAPLAGAEPGSSPSALIPIAAGLALAVITTSAWRFRLRWLPLLQRNRTT